MMEGREYMDYLRDILDGIEKAEGFIGGLDFEQFISDEKTAFAVVRAHWKSLAKLSRSCQPVSERLIRTCRGGKWQDCGTN